MSVTCMVLFNFQNTSTSACNTFAAPNWMTGVSCKLQLGSSHGPMHVMIISKEVTDSDKFFTHLNLNFWGSLSSWNKKAAGMFLRLPWDQSIVQRTVEEHVEAGSLLVRGSELRVTFAIKGGQEPPGAADWQRDNPYHQWSISSLTLPAFHLVLSLLWHVEGEISCFGSTQAHPYFW